MPNSRKPFEIAPTGAALGAEVRGLDLSRDHCGEVVYSLIEAFHDHLVLIFREQTLEQERLLDIAQWFGPLNVPPRHLPVLGDDDQPPVVPLSNYLEGGMLGNRDLFPHSDMSYLPIPLLGALLYAVEVPEAGGDTSWANLYLAYQELDGETRNKVAGLKTWSYNPYTPRFADRGADLGGTTQKFAEEDPPVFPHPIVRTHPVTGRKSLYIGGLCEEILGLDDPAEAKALLERLMAHVDQPHLYYNHDWRPGDVVIWDNRCTNHKRTAFDNTLRRLLYRVQIAGTRPF